MNAVAHLPRRLHREPLSGGHPGPMGRSVVAATVCLLVLLVGCVAVLTVLSVRQVVTTRHLDCQVALLRDRLDVEAGVKPGPYPSGRSC